MRALFVIAAAVGAAAWQNVAPLRALPPTVATDAPFLTSEVLFPLEHWHNHASMIVELPGGDLLTCWFHGSGERTADDVMVLGARLKKGSTRWSAPFVMADTVGYPDTNATMFLDPQKRLWLLWPTILANEWHTALMKYKIATDYRSDGAPRWASNDVLHITPGKEFPSTVNAEVDRWLATAPQDNDLEAGRYRLAVSLSDDEGQTWKWTRYLERDAETTDPRQRGEYHYPSIIQAADGTLHATYSFFVPPASVTPDAQQRLPRKTIKHAHFNESWIKDGLAPLSR